MEGQQRRHSQQAAKKGQKRKLEDAESSTASSGVDADRELEPFENASTDAVVGDSLLDSRQRISAEVRAQVEVLESSFSRNPPSHSATQRATHVLAKLVKNEEAMNLIVEGGAVRALVRHLQAPPISSADSDDGQLLYEHEVEMGSACALGLVAVKPEYQQLIVDEGAFPLLQHLDIANS